MGDARSYGGLTALAAKALASGGERRSLGHIEWDISGRCTAPITHEISARPEFRHDPALRLLPPEWRDAFKRSGLVAKVPAQGGFTWDAGDNGPLWVSLTVRCRKCVWCLRQRALLWSNKAQIEIARAPRTWFATFTGNPDEHFRWLLEARLLCSNRQTFESLTAGEQFRYRCQAAGPDITRYVKRIRKQSGARLRYLWVAERHQSGLPHWHALVHEVTTDKPIRKAVLKGQWPHGYSTFKLVDNPGAAWYLCKYLSKDLATRVRGSLRYGLPYMPPKCIT